MKKLRKFSVLLVSVALATLGQPSVARACLPGEAPELWRIVPAHTRDLMAPIITAHAAVIKRTNPDPTGPITDCDGIDFSALSLQLTSTDNMAAPEQIGYEFKVVAGALPPNMTMPTVALIQDIDFDFSMSRDDPRVSFTLEVRAVDGNGNRSAPLTIVIDEDPGMNESNAGCATSSSGSLAGSVIMVGIMALMRRHRRLSLARRSTMSSIIAK
jgi:hypothetical protein